MTPEIALTLGIVVVAVVLFATEKLRVDVIAMLVLLTVGLTGLVTPEQVFAGFANPAVITVWAVYIVSGALFRTGVADMLGERIIRLAGPSEPRLIAVIMLSCGTMSAFMNNIGATAVLLPAVIGISRQAKIPLSRLLIPLSFSSLMGGNMTLIGTPPNVLAAALLTERGLESFNFFSFTPMGIIVFSTGILYMVFFGRHLLPQHTKEQDPQDAYQLQKYVSEVRIVAGSKLDGQNLFDSRLGADYDFNVLFVIHEGATKTTPHRNTVLQAGDLIIVEGNLDNLLRAQQDLGVVIEAEHKWDWAEVQEEDFAVVQATLSPRSAIVGRTLRGIAFRDRYGFSALAIRRHGSVITERLRDVRLMFGDTLLLKGPKHRLVGLREGNEFLLLEPVDLETRRRHKAVWAVGIMLLVLLLVTLFKLPIALAMVIGAVLTVLSNTQTMDEAYQSIEWRSIFLIAGMLPLGLAMEATGTARYLADLLVGGLGSLGPLAVLAGIYILASLITEPMSNAAATVLIVPIAIDIAIGLNADPRAFVLATVIGASTSFLTPVGHQANVLVFGPGGYRFTDYTRVGFPLNVVIFIVTMVFLPMLWPL
ncbi:MAG: anion permease [Anaerolineae bacterium]|nr:anion permease [Anaerolineae bacterium]